MVFTYVYVALSHIICSLIFHRNQESNKGDPICSLSVKDYVYSFTANVHLGQFLNVAAITVKGSARFFSHQINGLVCFSLCMRFSDLRIISTFKYLY